MQVTTSKIGKITLKENIDFLEKLWTSKEVDLFLQDVEHLMIELKEGRYKKYPKFSKNVRSVLIGNKHVRVFFRIDKQQITILLFFEMRQDYAKIKEYLNQKL